VGLTGIAKNNHGESGVGRESSGGRRTEIPKATPWNHYQRLRGSGGSMREQGELWCILKLVEFGLSVRKQIRM